LTFLSGVSTAVGGLIVVLFGAKNHHALGTVLSFASGVMIYISFMDLMPEATLVVGFGWANVFFFVGVVFFYLFSRLIPEVGHTDPHPATATATAAASHKKNDDRHDVERHAARLYHVGLKTALGISLHNFPEGIAVYLSCLRGTALGLPLAIAIAAHNIPEGMAVASPILSSTKSRWRAFQYSLLSGLCEPLGALLVGVLFTRFISEPVVHASLAAVAGIMVLISFSELIPAAFEHGLDSKQVTFWNIVGMALMALNVWWLHYYLGFHQHLHSHSHSHHGHSHS